MVMLMKKVFFWVIGFYFNVNYFFCFCKLNYIVGYVGENFWILLINEFNRRWENLILLEKVYNCSLLFFFVGCMKI